MSVQLLKPRERLQFRMVVLDSFQTDKQYHAAVRALVDKMSREVFGGEPVDVHLTDVGFVTLKIVRFNKPHGHGHGHGHGIHGSDIVYAPERTIPCGVSLRSLFRWCLWHLRHLCPPPARAPRPVRADRLSPSSTNASRGVVRRAPAAAREVGGYGAAVAPTSGASAPAGSMAGSISGAAAARGRPHRLSQRRQRRPAKGTATAPFVRGHRAAAAPAAPSGYARLAKRASLPCGRAGLVCAVPLPTVPSATISSWVRAASVDPVTAESSIELLKLTSFGFPRVLPPKSGNGSRELIASPLLVSIEFVTIKTGCKKSS